MKTMRQENVNSAAKAYRCGWWFVLVLAFAVTGCGSGTSKTPPKQQVQDAVAAVLPPFLSLDGIELEPISTGPESVKINFKAIVAPKEGLYQVDQEADGTPRVTLIKMVQAAGTKVTLYGFVEARRMMDKWTLDSPLIQIGAEQFGKPRGAFAAQSYVTGTDEANAALRQQSVNAELQEKARKEALARQERERIAREEQQAREEQAGKAKLEEARRVAEEQRQKEEAERQKAEQVLREKLQLATVQGTRYVGTATRHPEKENQEVSRCRLVFKEQKDLLVTAELSNPDVAGAKRTFSGEIRIKHEGDKTDDGPWDIVMSPVGPDAKEGGGMYNFWCKALSLRLADKGMEGVARLNTFGEDRKLRLQRE